MSIRPFFCGNWKLFGTKAESLALAKGVAEGVADVKDADVGVSPGFLSLALVADALKGSPVAVAAQDGYWEENGAFTGQVAMAQIVDVGASHVIVGHSERRTLLGESDADVNRKSRAALAKGLVPVICVGETLEQRDGGTTLDVVGTQVKAALTEMSKEDIAKCIIAYEPVWAIGTGRNATPAQAVEVHAFIRGIVAEAIGEGSKSFRILYGGSVKPANVASLLSNPEINGALVGGASLTVESFVQLVKEGVAACTQR